MASIALFASIAYACSREDAPVGPTGNGAPDAGASADAAGDAEAPDEDAGITPPDGATSGPQTRPTGVMVHLFEWPWNDIAEECTRFLGPKGFSAVQVSPPSEHAILSKYPWYERYQTVGYDLTRSRSGTKDEFAKMVKTCADAGVAIYVDAVINHTTGQTSGVGSNGTKFTKYAYPGLYTASDFHQPTCFIADADFTTNADHLRRCELLHLADLDTGAAHVQSTLTAYLASLIEMGVRGFRVDAAKHILPADLDAILAAVRAATPGFPAPYFFFEVTYSDGEVVAPADYFGVGHASTVALDVTEFKVSAIGDAFLARGGAKISGLKDFGSSAWKMIPSDRALAFTTNHDTQRATAIYYADAAFDLANVFFLAWPYGYASVLSGYAFDRSTSDGIAMGPVSDASGWTLPIYKGDAPSCAADRTKASPGEWICEHRARSIANMVAFRAAAADTPVSDWWDNHGNQIAFGRGDRGFVIINHEDQPLHQTFVTSMKPGTYCDVLAGDFANGTCSGPTVTVSTGTGTSTGAGIDIEVPAGHAVAIHAGAKLQ